MQLKSSKRLSKPIKTAVLSAGLWLLSTPGYAFFCSGNGFNGYINLGDSEAKVAQTCGNPTTQAQGGTSLKQVATVEYWTYSNEKLFTNTNKATGGVTTVVKRRGPMLVLQITDGKVSQITANGISTKRASCGTGRQITVGAKSADILLSCGNPNGRTATHASPNSTANANTKITTWTYDYGQYRAPLVLEFTNGQLTKIGQ